MAVARTHHPSRLSRLHPRQLLLALDRIDAAPPSYTLTRPQALRRVFVTLACACVALLFIHYAKFARNLPVLLGDSLTRSLYATPWFALAGDAWWALCHLLGYVLLPWLVIRLIFGERMRDFGWRLADTRAHWQGYLLLLSPILVFVAIASFSREFVDHYPFYRHAGRSWVDLLGWQLLYLSQFVCLEFFFRGFLLNALRPAIGANAVWVMCVPYLMIHFPKPWPEAAGAILFGLLLGILALRSRSIWGGVGVHAGIAVAMDIAALLQKQALPTRWWPL